MKAETRKEMIDFLNKFKEGKADISELLPDVFLLSMNYGDRTEYFNDGKPISLEQYEEQSKSSKEKFKVTLDI